jgi:hypothetical protein
VSRELQLTSRQKVQMFEGRIQHTFLRTRNMLYDKPRSVCANLAIDVLTLITEMKKEDDANTLAHSTWCVIP